MPVVTSVKHPLSLPFLKKHSHFSMPIHRYDVMCIHGNKPNSCNLIGQNHTFSYLDWINTIIGVSLSKPHTDEMYVHDRTARVCIDPLTHDLLSRVCIDPLTHDLLSRVCTDPLTHDLLAHVTY